MDAKQLAERVRLGLRRSQVQVGAERLDHAARCGAVSLVWVTEELGRHTLRKVERTCAKYDIPLLRLGDTDEIGVITGMPSVRVYLLKRSFSGLRTVLRELREDGAI